MFDNWKGRWETKSAGVSPSACHLIEQKDVDWADIILVMAPYQKEYVTNHLKCSPDKIRSLGIEDKYNSQDPTELAELKKELLKKAAPILDMVGACNTLSSSFG